MEDLQGDGEERSDESSDPEIVHGWDALETGDVESARKAAQAVLAHGERVTPSAASRMDALLLLAACAREENDVDGALESLQAAAEEDPEWCTPELWMAEVLSEDPERLDQALRHARRALDRAEEEDEYLDTLRCKAAIELDLGRPSEARKTLKGLPPAELPLDDSEANLDFAQLLMDLGDAGEARLRLQAVVDAEPELADAWYLLGAAAELLGEEEAKRAAWTRTRALDLKVTDAGSGGGGGRTTDEEGTGQGTGQRVREAAIGREADSAFRPPRLEEDTLVALAEATLAELPPELRSLMENVPIVVAEMPAAADVATGLDPRLLGMFSGTPHAENGGVLDPAMLTEIVLFRRNIERFAVDDEMMADEVRTTLLHEAGHFFGLDEAALASMGLE